ncbi:L-threonylcarbamoyladenylate synthase [Candidatus Methanophagaceae archaeon]|nr:L-threonylcarbamoyladenylate synthase [Methanophagales archaeon]
MQSAIEGKIGTAITILKNGGTLIYPTETLYGLGADALSEEAVRKVYSIKIRALSQPLSLAVSSFEMLHEVAYVDSAYLGILKELLPGPVTVLLRKKTIVPDILTAGSDLVGIRFPDNEVALSIIKKAGPITSTSANVSGKKPPTCVEEVAEEIAKKADITINGGRCKYSMPSTVVVMSREAKEIKILREGAEYDRVLHVLQGKAAGRKLHGIFMS